MLHFHLEVCLPGWCVYSRILDTLVELTFSVTTSLPLKMSLTEFLAFVAQKLYA